MRAEAIPRPNMVRGHARRSLGHRSEGAGRGAPGYTPKRATQRIPPPRNISNPLKREENSMPSGWGNSSCAEIMRHVRFCRTHRVWEGRIDGRACSAARRIRTGRG
jgi:hypothetical protein